MVEIIESKVDKLYENAKMAYHHIGKLCECVEELRERAKGDYRDEDDDYDMSERRGRSGRRGGYRDDYREMNSRYSRY